VDKVINPDPSRGMFSSIQAGLLAADGDPVLVLPADMPFVSAATIAAVLAASTQAPRIVVPVHGGRRGHPVAFPASLREALLREPPTSTLKRALAGAGAEWTELPVDDTGVLRDIDELGDLTST
jgi:molybdenum cofactor cytidylyltransferase